jgi:diguanylate cyclase (GGDEF)-like protein
MAGEEARAMLSEVRIPGAELDALLPLNIRFDARSRIVHAGPTALKIVPDLAGQPLHRVLRLSGSRARVNAARLLDRARPRLQLVLHPPVAGARGEAAPRPPAGQRLTAAAVPLPDGEGLLVPTFGSRTIGAVQAHGLTQADFGPTDLSLELLMLVETQAAVRGIADRLREQLEAERSEASALALLDKLTGLRNRHAIDRTLEDHVRWSIDPFGLMHLDLDFFKAVNDSLGHAAGDHVLREVAQILRREVRSDDMVARIGGDEFLLVFQGCADAATLRRIGERLVARISRPIPFEGQECRVSASIGIASSRGGAPEGSAADVAQALVAEADAALYRAKRAGRGRVRLSESLAASGA